MSFSYEQPDYEQRDYLEHLASGDVLERLRKKQVRGIAVVHGVGERREPVGLMVIGEHAGGSLVLEWLYVAERYRHMGIAAGLMSKFFELAHFYRFRQVSALLYPGMMGDTGSEEMADFLQICGMKNRYEDTGPWMVTGSRLRRLLEWNRRLIPTAKTDRMVALKDMPKEELALLLKSILPGFRKISRTIDLGASCAERSDNGLLGLLLVEKTGDVYTPKLLKAINKQAEKRLLSWMYQRLAETMQPEECLRIWDASGEYVEWMVQDGEVADAAGAIRLESEI